MSRWTAPLRGGALGLLAAVTVVLTTGCGVGQVTETAQISASIPGVDANAGNIAIRNARIAYPDGGVAQVGDRATLLMTLGNSSTSTQKLLTVTSPAATSTALSSTLAFVPSTSASPSASASSTDTSDVSLTIPAQGLLQLTSDGESVVLLDLTRELVSGRTVPVTMTFSNGASVTMTVPIAVPDSYQGDPTATPTAGLDEPANR